MLTLACNFLAFEIMRKKMKRGGINIISLRKHAHAIYSNISRLLKCKFSDEKLKYFFSFFLLLNIDCGYTLEPPHFLMNTHNQCFRAKEKRKNVYPFKPQFYCTKRGV